MARKKSVPAKKAAPAKKTSKPVVKAVSKKSAPKKAAAKVLANKTAAPKKATKKSSVRVKKTAPKKAIPTKATVKTTLKKVEKKAPVKKTVVKAAAPQPKVAVKKTVLPPKVAKKATSKSASAKEKTTKPPVVPKLSTKSAVKYRPDFSKSILDIPKNEQVKSVVRYSDVDLQEFKEIILRKLDAAKKELAYLQGLITRRDEGGDMDEGRYMTMEDGSLSMEREQLSQMASRQISFIDKLEKALMRVENKTYGICRVTGNLIDKARLRAVPHATLSMEAKSTMSK